MTDLIEGAGVEIAVSERGAGPPVLLIHGMASDALALEPLVLRLADAARVIAYDRRGYGGSGAPEPYEGTTVEEQAEDAAALLRRLGAAPALVCGDGFGALVALDLLKRHAGLIRAAVLSNPPLFAFVPEANEELALQRQQLQDALQTAGPEAAVETWLGGRVSDEALARAKAAHLGFFADYAGLASWPVTRGELRAMTVPVAVVTGPWSPPHIVKAAEAIAGLVPGAVRREDGDMAAAARELLTG